MHFCTHVCRRWARARLQRARARPHPRVPPPSILPRRQCPLILDCPAAGHPASSKYAPSGLARRFGAVASRGCKEIPGPCAGRGSGDAGGPPSRGEGRGAGERDLGQLPDLPGRRSSPATRAHGLRPPVSPGPREFLEARACVLRGSALASLAQSGPAVPGDTSHSAAYALRRRELPGPGRGDGESEEGSGPPKWQRKTPHKPPPRGEAPGTAGTREKRGARGAADFRRAPCPPGRAAPGGSRGPQHLQLREHLHGRPGHAVVLFLTAAGGAAGSQPGHVSRSRPRPAHAPSSLAGAAANHASARRFCRPPACGTRPSPTAPSYWAAAPLASLCHPGGRQSREE